jgi:hypothetical protein
MRATLSAAVAAIIVAMAGVVVAAPVAAPQTPSLIHINFGVDALTVRGIPIVRARVR